MEERADTADRADDLIPEESELVQRALKRLSPKESYDRVFRMRRAFQVYRREEIPKTTGTRLTG
jgi:ubiquinol-cytochrome c reductase subunit 7